MVRERNDNGVEMFVAREKYSKFSGLIFALTCLALTPAITDAQKGSFPATVRTELGANWKVSGTVSSESGRPLSNVKVFLFRSGAYQPMTRSHLQLGEPESTDRLGKYQIKVNENQSILFVADGFAPFVSKVPEGSALDAQLSTGRTISGIVLLPSGEPAKNALVTPVQWLEPREKKLVNTGQSTENPNSAYSTMIYGTLPNFGSDRAVKTNSEGWFEIKHQPANFRVGLSIKSPGTKEEVVYVQPEGDGQGKDFKNQTLEDNEFLYELNSSAALKLTASTVDNNKKATIAKITFQPIQNDEWMMRSAHRFRYSQEFGEPNVTTSIREYPNGVSVLVEPSDSQTLLGVKLEFPTIGELETIEKEIQFPTGKPIHGIVKNAKTGEPIPGVQIRWRHAVDFKEWNEQGHFPKLEIETDKNGEFSFAVPDEDGLIGIVGEVEGYCSVSNWNPLNPSKLSTDIREQFTRELKKGELDNNPDCVFELQPSYKVEVTVVGADGAPVSNCVVSATQIQLSIFNEGSRTLNISEQTDQNGKIIFDHWYQDAYNLAKARQELLQPKDKSPQGMQYGFNNSIYPSRIQAFTDDGFRQGIAAIPLPPEDAETNTIPVTISLLAGGTVLGRVVGIDDAPVGELKIEASMLAGSYWGAGQTWKTQTRTDGWFKMEGLPADGEFVWKLDNSRVKTTEGGGRLKLDTSELTNGKTVEIELAVCIDLSALLEELPGLEIGNLSNEKAFDLLSKYIANANSRIPEKYSKYNHEDPEYRKFFSSRSSEDPIPSYRKRLADKASKVIKELAERDPGSEFEFRLLKFSAAALSGQLTSNHEFDRYTYERLLASHANRADAQKLLIEMTARTDNYSTDQNWLDLYHATDFDETKLAASYRIAFKHLQKCVQCCNGQTDQKLFNRHIKNLKKYLAIIRENKVEGKEAEATRKQMNEAIKVQADVSYLRGGQIFIQGLQRPQPSGKSTKALEKLKDTTTKRTAQLKNLLDLHFKSEEPEDGN